MMLRLITFISSDSWAMSTSAMSLSRKSFLLSSLPKSWSKHSEGFFSAIPLWHLWFFFIEVLVINWHLLMSLSTMLLFVVFLSFLLLLHWAHLLVHVSHDFLHI